MIFSLVLPGLLVFIFAILAPICLSVYYGFTDYSGMGQATFIGMENYKTLLHDKSFGRALLNSLLLAIGFICIQHPIAIVVAAVLDKLSGKAEGFFRCVYFIPNVISVAVIAYLWKFIYNPDFGLLNNVFKVFGYQGKINWFSADNAIWSGTGSAGACSSTIQELRISIRFSMRRRRSTGQTGRRPSFGSRSR